MRSPLLFLVGLIVLALNKIRYGLRGYKEPRPFSPTDFEQASLYDRHVVNGWIKALHDYTGQKLEGKVVLELGPGADLGPALLLLEAGAKQYFTVDANRLIDKTPLAFYESLLASCARSKELLDEVRNTLAKRNGRIQYVVDPSFNLSALQDRGIDLVVSQAAFEHFSDVEKTIEQLSTVVHSGCTLVAEIDLMTHTGILRQRDPLNIYRFSPWLYRLARFSGIPNRVRPESYKASLQKNGWYNVRVVPLQTLSQQQVNELRPGLAPSFKDDPDLHILSFLLLATKR